MTFGLTPGDVSDHDIRCEDRLPDLASDLARGGDLVRPVEVGACRWQVQLVHRSADERVRAV
jgi:hypothetical protein